MLLTGEAGIGKSRLLQELVARIPPKTSFQMPSQCWPRYSVGALHPGFEVFMHHLLHVSPESSPKTQLWELEMRLTSFGMSPEHVQAIGLFLNLPVADDAVVRQLTPERRKELIFEALATMLRLLAMERPVLVTVEDMHWADSFRMELFGYLLEHIGQSRILLVLTARPEFQPPWPPRPWFHRLVLDRLGPALAGVLVKAASNKPLQAELVRELANRSDGIPLFIEELVRMLLERGGEAKLPSTLPVTLHELLLARLDLLPTRQRALVRLCSVVGRDFSLSLLLALTRSEEAPLKRELAGLLQGGLFQERRDGSKPGGPVYLFRHALLQDAAYASLSWRERRHYHRRIARVLREHFAREMEARPEVLAHHLTGAGHSEQAISWWLRAGQLAQTRSATKEAVEHLTQSLTLLRGLPDASQRTAEELRILLALGLPLSLRHGYGSPEAERVYDRAWALLEQLGDSLPSQELPYGGWFAWHYARAELSRCQALSERLVRLGELHSIPDLLLQGNRMMAYYFVARGRPRLALECAERAVALCSRAGHERSYLETELQYTDPRVTALSYAPVVCSLVGRPERARRYSQQAVELAQRLGHPHTLAHALTYTAVACGIRREARSVLEWTERAISISSERSYELWRVWSSDLQGWALAEVGRPQEGLELLQRELQRWRGFGLRIGISYHQCLLAEIHLKLGQNGQGLLALEEARAWMRKTGERFYEAELHRLRGEHLKARGRAHEARYCFFRALAVARQQDAGLFEVRAAVGLARLLLEEGMPEKARHLLGWSGSATGTIRARRPPTSRTRGCCWRGSRRGRGWAIRPTSSYRAKGHHWRRVSAWAVPRPAASAASRKVTCTRLLVPAV